MGTGKPKRRLRARRGSTLIESVLVITLVSILFWYLFLIADLCMIRVVSDHSANVMGRSHAVGFNNEIVQRAMRVGSIPIAGNIMNPTTSALGVNSQAELGQFDEILIENYVQELAAPGGNQLMDYQHWDKLYKTSGSGDLGINSVKTYQTRFVIEFGRDDYALGNNDYLNNSAPSRHRISLIPGIWWFMDEDRFDIEGESRMLNHAAYYLEGGGNH